MNFKKSLVLITSLLLMVGALWGQTPYGSPLSQSLTVTTVVPPVNTQLLGSGSGFSCTGSAGSFSAGTYVVVVTYTGLATSSESKASSDGGSTLTTLVTCSANGTLSVPSPPPAPGCANCVGYRVYVIASSSGTGAELLQTITSSTCSLSTAALTSCAIGSTFTETALGAGAAVPSNPTLFTPNGTGGTTFGAFPPLYESGLGIQTHYLAWTTTGTAATCTIAYQTSPDNVTFTTQGTAQTCTSSGFYAVNSSAAVYARINLTAFTATGANVPSIQYTLLEGANTVPSYTYINCGTATACSPNATIGSPILKFVYGQCTASAATTCTVTAMPAFTATTSFVCFANTTTTTANGALKVAIVSTSSITITSPSSSDTFNYYCLGT